MLLGLGDNVVDQDFEDLLVDVGYIGDMVWWDIDGDGLQDAGEPGIPGVTVELLKNGSVINTTATDAYGIYAFTALPAGDYEVRILSNEFAAGGTLENWTASPLNVGTDEAVDSDGDLITHVAPVTLTSGQGTTSVDFGFGIASGYTLTKTLTSDNPSRLGQPVTFAIVIVNTGNTWLSTLPLQDTYNSTYLTYGFGSTFATPDTVDHVNDGVLDWTDLTAAAPYGFGADIAPGQTVTVSISFTARADTSALGPAGVVNTVNVANAVADPDGPAGSAAAPGAARSGRELRRRQHLHAHRGHPRMVRRGGQGRRRAGELAHRRRGRDPRLQCAAPRGGGSRIRAGERGADPGAVRRAGPGGGLRASG